MRDTGSLHLKLQEYADCYMESDPEKELEDISRKGVGGDKTNDPAEVALKYLALAVIDGIERGARRIRIQSNGSMNGSCSLILKSERVPLPAPPSGIAGLMVGIVRCITHLERDTGKSKLVYGLRNDQIEVDVEADRNGAEEEIILHLPQVLPD
ncbi:MAG: hypothetical protein AB1640_24975 [bacterium]